MNQILRYDKVEAVTSDLDPIEDILNFISTLKSKGYTIDLLKEVFGFTQRIDFSTPRQIVENKPDRKRDYYMKKEL